MHRALGGLVTVVVLAAVAPASADSVVGADRLVCAPMSAHECRADGICVDGAPWDFDIGPFFRIDLKGRRLESTDESKGRSTDIKTVERGNDLIVVQGFELGRAFSVLVSEESGFMTGSITVDDGVIAVFGACKPE
jgi:hypothetical protein